MATSITRSSRIDAPSRLAELHALAILDTASEPAYDDLAALAGVVCESPVAAVNFVDAERHFTKAIAGMPEAAGGSVPNHLSFCATTLEMPEGVLFIDDTHADPSWASHPLVEDGPRVRSYAGVALRSRGERVGVLCAFGPEPRRFAERERRALETLARQAEAQLELRRRNIDLAALAVTDPLTGLANRTLLVDRLDRALAERSRSGGEVGVLYCDVDGFKAVNDEFGHEAGDRLLCEVAARLRASIRASDTAARIAGDEFVVVCPGAGAGALEAVARRLRASESARTPRLSVGAVLAIPGDTAASVLRRADEAMYAEKRRRRAGSARRAA